jgi:hypothetical protein
VSYISSCAKWTWALGYIQWVSVDNSLNAVCVAILCVFGLFVFGVVLFMLLHREHPIWVAASPVMSFLIQIGLCMGYFSVLTFIGEPTDLMCVLQPWILGIAWVMVVA